MKHRRAELNDTSIVIRPGWPPLIKHEEFTGTLDELSKRIPSTRKNKNEAHEYLKKGKKWIEITIELCELEDDEDKIALMLDKLQEKAEAVLHVRESKQRLCTHRKMLEVIKQQAEDQTALGSEQKIAAAEESRDNAKAEVLTTSAVL